MRFKVGHLLDFGALAEILEGLPFGRFALFFEVRLLGLEPLELLGVLVYSVLLHPERRVELVVLLCLRHDLPSDVSLAIFQRL